MEWVIWGFALLAAVVAGIIGIAAWVVLWRDRDLPNNGVQNRPRPAGPKRPNVPRGVPKSR